MIMGEHVHDDIVQRISQGIDDACTHGGELVRIFLTRPDEFGTGFAGATFDRFQPGDPNRWEASDLLAVTLLDVGVRPRGVRDLLERDPNGLGDALHAVRADVELWSDDDDAVNSALDVAQKLFIVLRQLSGVGPVTASKLLARKRPKLIPIKDRVIQSRLTLRDSDPFWRPLRTALRQDGVMDRIRALRPDGFEDLSELRLLDIALWMLGSNSTAARAARRKAGVE
jgi:hypothetical protein